MYSNARLADTMKVLIALNTTWNLVNFRAGLIKAFVARGYEVVGVAPVDHYVSELEKLGCRHVPVIMDNQGTSPVNDFRLFLEFVGVLRREKPDVVLAYTVKPNVYGSLAAHLLGIPVLNNIAGLGSVFIRHSLLTRLVKGLYALALSRSSKVFFQNREDREQFIVDGLVREGCTDVLPGSGIDLEKFSYTPHSLGDVRPFRFLLVARMLWDKGVGEFVQAAQVVNRLFPEVEFCLLGFVDVENPAAISRECVDSWVSEGVIAYLGVSDDVVQEISNADCVVLPSYYPEGTPRSLLEAAAIGRPIITTDTTGCRDVVEDGRNGLLCKLKDAHDLADKMIRMLQLSDNARCAMGKYGRKKMEREYDERIVIEKYLLAVEDAICAR